MRMPFLVPAEGLGAILAPNMLDIKPLPHLPVLPGDVVRGFDSGCSIRR